MKTSRTVGWQGLALAIGAGILLVQGLQAESRHGSKDVSTHVARQGTAPHVRVAAVDAETPRRLNRDDTPAASPGSPPSRETVLRTPVLPAPLETITPVVTGTVASRSADIEKPSPSASATISAQVAAQPALPHESDDALDVTSAERLGVKVQGLPELSGDYRINDDQTISVPVIGRVSVARMEPSDLERDLAQRIARVTGREAFVTVEIAEYRPVFVSGYVSRPGTAPWKPGLTVLQAITIAGGDFRTAGGASDNVTLRIQRAVDDQKRILAQIARLEAERSGAATISVPDRLIARVGKKQAEELIASQRTLFESRRSASDAQIAGLERAIALTRQEMESMNGQRKRLLEQLEFRREQFTRMKQLFDRGLLRNDKMHEEQLKLADIDERLASVGVSAARANSTLVGLERELADARQKRRAEIDTELLKLERDSAQLDLEIKSFGAATEKSQFATAGGEVRETVTYEIVRQSRNGSRSIPADRYSLLRPGDMVVVSMK